MKVEYWRGSNGRIPVAETIKEIDMQWRKKIVKILGKIQEYGLLLQKSYYLERVDGTSLYEIRIPGKMRYRIYGPITNDTFWACHIILKKSARPPLSDIALAEERARQILNHHL